VVTQAEINPPNQLSEEIRAQSKSDPSQIQEKENQVKLRISLVSS
jgi:hypothetical protein